MTTCRNCRSSLPDGSKFCNVCGYQTGELPIILPSSRENVSPNSPAMGDDEKTLPSAGRVRRRDHTSTPPPLSDPTHGDHHQPSPSHGPHQQTQPTHGPHQQAQPTHGPHQQAQPMHGLHQQAQPMHGPHQQAQPTHGPHQQAQPMHGPHQQPQGLHAAHHQSVASHTRHLNKIRSGYRPSWLVIGVSSVILVALITVGTLFVVNLSRQNSNVATTSNANLVPSGKAIPGQTLQVVGNHFPTSQTVFLTLDGQPLANTGATAHTWRSSTVNLASVSSANVSGTPVAVDAKGTFTVIIHIDSNWKVGSTHHLTVFNQQGKELKSLNLTIEGDQSKPATSAIGTIEVENIDMQNLLYLPAGTILTNTAGCTVQKLQISLDGDVNRNAYSGEYNYPGMAVPIHVVQRGTAGNIQDCQEGYAFHYCSPACDGSETWDAYDTNGGFSGGTGSQQ